MKCSYDYFKHILAKGYYQVSLLMYNLSQKLWNGNPVDASVQI